MSDGPVTTSRRRVLVVTLDTLGERMAGPAIRTWEIATALAPAHDVRVVTFGTCDRVAEGFAAAHITVAGFEAAVAWAEIVVLQGYVMATFPWLRTADVVIVADLYDPFHLESLEVQRHDASAERDAGLANALRELDAQISRADLFLCASRRQRDLWIGHLAAAGRVNPLTYDADPSLGSLIRIVPFGIPADPPERRGGAIRGTAGIGPADPVLLWGGGVYNWFDPLTLIRAVDRLRVRVPDVRLYFLGMRHPNPDVAEMRMATSARNLAAELGLTGVHVFFNEDWVPYERRADFLLDADVGVSCHLPHVETEFSFRTRMLDYLWAGLPMVSTRGDAFAELIDAEELGRTVPAEDVDALVGALELVLTDAAARARYRENVRRVARDFTWPRVLAPLVDFCAAPAAAADAARVRRPAVASPTGRPPAIRPLHGAVVLLRHLRTKGLRRTVARIRWKLQTRRQRAGD